MMYRALALRLFSSSLFVAGSLALASAETETDELSPDPISNALMLLSEDVRVYNDHLVTLASPFMEGRVPGSRGMEIAKEYCEFWMLDAGLEPAFEVEGQPSFRQPFPLRGTAELVSQSMSGPGLDELEPGVDFTAMSLGGSGGVFSDVVFCGYSITEGPDGYKSFSEDDSLEGKIALVLRFEPMTEDGKSTFTDSGRWSGSAGLVGKVRAAVEKGAAAIVIVNTPGADDERVGSLSSFNSGGTGAADVPVFMLMGEPAEQLVASAGHSLRDLQRAADAGRAIVPLGVTLELTAEIESKEMLAENVGGLLPGRGELADELVVVGAHLDHLGMGFFGSRDSTRAGKELHPGADDNASGVAAILMIADKMVEDYASLPADQPLRTVLFLAFSAEESGLNGARYYVQNPIRPIEEHALMLNFDMIGRITENQLSVSGVGTGQGLDAWLEPIFKASPLDIVPRQSGGGGSDHLAFLSAEVPSLFAIIAKFHDDYHTPDDTSDKINRVDAVKAMLLWRDIALSAAQRSEPFEFIQVGRDAKAGGSRARIRVRFGIQPAEYGEGEGGILVAQVLPETSASEGGLQAEDVIVSWNGNQVDNVGTWMEQLAEHAPGDEVQVGVLRDGELRVLDVVLKPSRARGQ